MSLVEAAMQRAKSKSKTSASSEPENQKQSEKDEKPHLIENAIAKAKQNQEERVSETKQMLDKRKQTKKPLQGEEEEEAEAPKKLVTPPRKSNARSPSPRKLKSKTVQQKAIEPAKANWSLFGILKRLFVAAAFVLVVMLLRNHVPFSSELPQPVSTIPQLVHYSPLELANKKDLIQEDVEQVKKLSRELERQLGSNFDSKKSLQALWESYVELKKEANIQAIVIVSFLLGLLVADYFMK